MQHGETGVIVSRLPPGARCVECDEDATALDSFIDTIEQMQTFDRGYVRAIAAELFDSSLIVDGLISFLAPVAFI